MTIPADHNHEFVLTQSIVPVLVAATANGTGVDLLGFGTATVVVNAGVITDGTHTLKVQDSPDNSTFTDVAAASLSGALTALTSGAGGSATQKVGYLGGQRYIRAVTTVTGSPSTGGVYGVSVIKAGARTLPQ